MLRNTVMLYSTYLGTTLYTWWFSLVDWVVRTSSRASPPFMHSPALERAKYLRYPNNTHACSCAHTEVTELSYFSVHFHSHISINRCRWSQRRLVNGPSLAARPPSHPPINPVIQGFQSHLPHIRPTTTPHSFPNLSHTVTFVTLKEHVGGQHQDQHQDLSVP